MSASARFDEVHPDPVFSLNPTYVPGMGQRENHDCGDIASQFTHFLCCLSVSIFFAGEYVTDQTGGCARGRFLATLKVFKAGHLIRLKPKLDPPIIRIGHTS
jgi:hypothetical protein